MPGFDGTGPLGKGPMTGNGKGYCILKTNKEKPEKIEGYIGLQGQDYSKEITDIDYPVPGYLNLIPGQGFKAFGYGFLGRGRRFFGRGRGRGRGRGFRMMGWIPYPGSPYLIYGIAPYAIPYSQ